MSDVELFKSFTLTDFSKIALHKPFGIFNVNCGKISKICTKISQNAQILHEAGLRDPALFHLYSMLTLSTKGRGGGGFHPPPPSGIIKFLQILLNNYTLIRVDFSLLYIDLI